MMPMKFRTEILLAELKFHDLFPHNGCLKNGTEKLGFLMFLYKFSALASLRKESNDQSSIIY